MTTQPALEAFETVLAEAGAILPSRDQVDSRVIRDVRDGTGAVINTENDIPDPGRWQTYHSLPAPADTDGDGLPDYWERQFGLDPNDPRDATIDTDGDGYTNVEEYANNTDPKGGALPVVSVSASESRAWREGARPGEFRVWRNGTEGDLEVRYVMGGKPGSVVIPRGVRYTGIAVPPASDADIIVLSLAASPGYHAGCPNSALVAVADGTGPVPVRIGNIDPKGNVTPEDLAWAARVNRKHAIDKKAKIRRREESLADPNEKTRKPANASRNP